MNPLAGFSEKEFDELDYYEIIQVMNAYSDENKYPIYFKIEPKRTALVSNAIASFEGQIGNISILKTYFNNWTK